MARSPVSRSTCCRTSAPFPVSHRADRAQSTTSTGIGRRPSSPRAGSPPTPPPLDPRDTPAGTAAGGMRLPGSLLRRIERSQDEMRRYISSELVRIGDMTQPPVASPRAVELSVAMRGCAGMAHSPTMRSYPGHSPTMGSTVPLPCRPLGAPTSRPASSPAHHVGAHHMAERVLRAVRPRDVPLTESVPSSDTTTEDASSVPPEPYSVARCGRSAAQSVSPTHLVGDAGGLAATMLLDGRLLEARLRAALADPAHTADTAPLAAALYAHSPDALVTVLRCFLPQMTSRELRRDWRRVVARYDQQARRGVTVAAPPAAARPAPQPMAHGTSRPGASRPGASRPLRGPFSAEGLRQLRGANVAAARVASPPLGSTR